MSWPGVRCWVRVVSLSFKIPLFRICAHYKLSRTGIDCGSAVGMVKKLHALGLDSTGKRVRPIERYPRDKLQLLGDNLRNEIEDMEEEMDGLCFLPRSDSVVTASNANVPGVVILNAGKSVHLCVPFSRISRSH